MNNINRLHPVNAYVLQLGLVFCCFRETIWISGLNLGCQGWGFRFWNPESLKAHYAEYLS